MRTEIFLDTICHIVAWEKEHLPILNIENGASLPYWIFFLLEATPPAEQILVQK